jgi:CheY-like chemotaxis protein/HPt (histidine-containing phosphotransfer) domain-containing protein
MVSILANQGHTAFVANNGKEALAAWVKDSFDLILMDVQMPEMDGLEAAAAIRDRERNTGRHTPIIAVTTQVLEEDRQRCRQAGMDAHVAKPVRAGELQQIMADVLPSAGGPAPPVPDGPLAPEVLNSADMLDRMGRNWELLQELVEMFFEDCPQWMAAIRDSIRRGDARGLKVAAHTLRGAVAHFSAGAAAEAARTLEAMGRAGDLMGAAEAYATLEEAIRGLETALTRFMRTPLSHHGEVHHDRNGQVHS